MPTFESHEQQKFVRSELKRAYQTGAWEKGTSSRYVSRLFCVSKPNGAPTAEYPDGVPRWRLVLDLTPLNKWCKKHSMKCESLRTLAAMGLNPGALMFSWDLEDGFHSFGIDPDYRQYMTFRLLGELHQIASVPFGWTSSPYVFQECMKVVCKLLRTPDLPSESAMKAGVRGQSVLQRVRPLKVRAPRKQVVASDDMPP